jgi:hypothetical protein
LPHIKLPADLIDKTIISRSRLKKPDWPVLWRRIQLGLKLDAKAGISFLPATHQHRFAEHWQAHDFLAQARCPSLLRKKFNNLG